MDDVANDSLGMRLRAERERLQLSQEQLATLGGVKKLTQIQYEKDKTSPTAKYLLAVAAVGVDVMDVLGLVPNTSDGQVALTPRQASLLQHYRAASREGQQAIDRLAMLEAQQTVQQAAARAAPTPDITSTPSRGRRVVR